MSTIGINRSPVSRFPAYLFLALDLLDMPPSPRRVYLKYCVAPAACLLWLTSLLFAQEPAREVAQPEIKHVRERAKVLHEVFHSTLKVIHRRYFHEDRAVVPARAMEDIFDEMKHDGHFEARWIAVNLRAMGIDHEPANEFEMKAAEALKDGKTEYETIENDIYRRVAAIPLQNGCIGCHEGGLRSSGTKGKLAALIISIPLRQDSLSADKNQ